MSASDFFLAVNYPWLNYGRDFGESPWGYSGVSSVPSGSAVAADFAQIKSAGVSVVRWFLLCDGRSGIRFENEVPTAFDSFFFKDLAAALALAAQSGLKICFSLFDFLWLQSPDKSRPQLPGRAALLTPCGREALLQNILIPLFREFRAHPALYAWEIVNEPEWAIPEFQPSPVAQLSMANARAFFAEVAEAIHTEARLPATLGSARLQWVRAWAEIGLDSLQAHYYPKLESDQRLTLAQQISRLQDIDTPLWIGELPANDPAFPDYSLTSALTACRNAGLAGAGVWRWRPPESGSEDSSFGTVQPQTLLAWNTPSPDISV
jgi:hypothetical protein